MLYDSSLKYKWDNKNVLDYAVKEAAKKAAIEGEKKALVKVAHEMKKNGISIEQIAKITKLPLQEIEKL